MRSWGGLAVNTRNALVNILAAMFAVVLAVALVFKFGWISIVIASFPIFLWMTFRHFKNFIASFLFIYLIIHFTTFSYFFSITPILRGISFILLVGLVVIYYQFSRKEHHNFRLPTFYYILFLLLLIILSIGTLNSLDILTSFQYLFWYTIFLFFIFFLLPKEFGSIHKVINLLYVFICAGLFILIISIFTLPFQGIVDRGGNIAIRGFFSNNNTMGMVAFSTSGLSLLVLYFREYLSKYNLLITKTSAFISPIFVLLSSSRASILGLLTAIFLFGIIEKRSRKLSIFSLTISLTLYFFAGSFINKYFRIESLNSSGGIFGERSLLFQYVMDSMSYIPWYGLGLGLQDHLYLVSRAIPTMDVNSGMIGFTFHNSYLQILVETGIFGSIIYLTLLITTFMMVFKIKNRENRRFILVVNVLLFGMIINSFFESALLLPGSPYSLLFWTLICIVHIIYNHDKRIYNLNMKNI